MYTYRFEWKAPASSVFVTGSFDNWAKSVRLSKHGDVFTGNVTLAQRDKLVFKFVVDDVWVTSDDYGIETDASGIANNYVDAGDLSVLQEFDSEDPTTGDISAADLGAGSGILQSGHAADAQQFPKEHSDSDSTPLAQVLTSSSSFAAVSLPSESNADSAIDSAYQDAYLSDSTLDRATDSNTATANATPTASQIIKPPGAYPESPPDSPSSTAKQPPRKDVKRDGLVSRFRSLFRY